MQQAGAQQAGSQQLWPQQVEAQQWRDFLQRHLHFLAQQVEQLGSQQLWLQQVEAQQVLQHLWYLTLHFFTQQVEQPQPWSQPQAFSQQAGAQQPLPSKPAWALETLTTATMAATANADNRIRRYMGGTPWLGKTLWDTHAKSRR